MLRSRSVIIIRKTNCNGEDYHWIVLNNNLNLRENIIYLYLRLVVALLLPIMPILKLKLYTASSANNGFKDKYSNEEQYLLGKMVLFHMKVKL